MRSRRISKGWTSIKDYGGFAPLNPPYGSCRGQQIGYAAGLLTGQPIRMKMVDGIQGTVPLQKLLPGSFNTISEAGRDRMFDNIDVPHQVIFPGLYVVQIAEVVCLPSAF